MRAVTHPDCLRGPENPPIGLVLYYRYTSQPYLCRGPDRSTYLGNYRGLYRIVYRPTFVLYLFFVPIPKILLSYPEDPAS